MTANTKTKCGNKSIHRLADHFHFINLHSRIYSFVQLSVHANFSNYSYQTLEWRKTKKVVYFNHGMLVGIACAGPVMCSNSNNALSVHVQESSVVNCSVSHGVRDDVPLSITVTLANRGHLCTHVCGRGWIALSTKCVTLYCDAAWESLLGS